MCPSSCHWRGAEVSYLQTCSLHQDRRSWKACHAHFVKNRKKLYRATSPSQKETQKEEQCPEKKNDKVISAQCSMQVETSVSCLFRNLAEVRVGGNNLQAAKLKQRAIQSLASSSLLFYLLRMGTCIPPPNTDLTRSRYIFSLAPLPNLQVYDCSRSFQCSEDEVQALNTAYA